MLDVTALQVVIVGGGSVAARKAIGLLDAGATRIRVVSPDICDAMPAAVERVYRRYESGELKGANLVFASTDSTAVNDAVVADAKSAGAWACRADGSDEVPGDFVTPAKFQRGAVMVSVSAGSAALTARIREGLEQRFDPAWAAMADAMSVLRPMVLASALDAPSRRDLFRELAGDEAMNVLQSGGLDGLKRWLQLRLSNRE